MFTWERESSTKKLIEEQNNETLNRTGSFTAKEVCQKEKVKDFKTRVKEQIKKNRHRAATLEKGFKEITENVQQLKSAFLKQNQKQNSLEQKCAKIIQNNFQLIEDLKLHDNRMLKKKTEELSQRFLSEMMEFFAEYENEYINQIEIFKLEEAIKVDEKLAAYTAATIKMEESMQIINSKSLISSKIQEINNVKNTIEDQVNSLKNLHSHRESLESQFFEDLTTEDKNVPPLDLNHLHDNFAYDAKEIAFNTTQKIDVKEVLKQLRSQRSMEQGELENIKTSLTRYEQVREELELEIQQLQKKNLLLQQDLNLRDEKIQKLERDNKLLSNNSFRLNMSGVSSIPRTRLYPNRSNLKKMAKHIRRKNYSQVMSESKKMIFRTPDATEKNTEKGRNTAEVDKSHPLEVKSNNSFVDINPKAMDLSDLLKSTDYDPSEFHNILEDDLLSNDLVSLSNNDIECDRNMVEEWTRNQEIGESDNTPNFPNRMQSKIDNLLKQDPLNKDENNIEGKYLNMSLGDIPEEFEEGTFTDMNPSSFDKIMSYNSNTSNGNTGKSKMEGTPSSSAKEILKIKKGRSKGSGDSRFSTYMNSDVLYKQNVSQEMSNSKQGQDSLILKPKEIFHTKYNSKDNLKSPAAEGDFLEPFLKQDKENAENLSLVSNSGNKDPSNYQSRRGVIKPRNIFG